MTKKQEKLCPSKGGCWFCSLDQCDAFSSEFDAHVHISCVKTLLRANNVGEQTGEFVRDVEVDIMAKELGIEV